MRLFFSTILAMMCCSCYEKPKANGRIPSIVGIWSYVENDSIYGEVIITADHLWEYSEHAGEYFVAYEIEDDSIHFANSITSKMDKILKDEFRLVRPGMTTQYSRLSIPLDTAAILRGDQNVLQEYVVTGFRIREMEWGIKHYPNRYDVKR